jgi:hypothetical protein
MAWAFTLDLRPSALKFLLVCVCDNVNTEGEFFPSIGTLMLKTCQDRKTVIAGLQELQQRGLIEDTGERKGRTQQVKIYRLIGFDTGFRHYTYHVEDPATGEFYIGVRTCIGAPETDVSYMGSGTWPLAALRQRRALKKQVLQEYTTRNEAIVAEAAAIGRSIGDPLCRNFKSPENGTLSGGKGPENGTVSNGNADPKGPVFPTEGSRFSHERVPKTVLVYRTVREPSEEPSVGARASGAPTTDGELDARSAPAQDPHPATQSAASVPSQGRSTQAAIEPIPRRRKQQLASRLPESFELTPDRRAMALTEGLDAERTFAKFCDHWRAAPDAKAHKADWDATWRNWCRTEADRIAAIAPKPLPAAAATRAEHEDLRALMGRRAALGIGGFRDPTPGETAEHYRQAQNHAWNAKQPRTDGRFKAAQA